MSNENQSTTEAGSAAGLSVAHGSAVKRYSIRNYLGHEVGTVETAYDAVPAYAVEVNASLRTLLDAGYTAVEISPNSDGREAA